MSTAEAYGTITDGDGAGAAAAAGGVRNHNMNLAFTTNDGVAVYKPVIPQSSAQNPAPATPTQAYQAGSSGNGSAAATSREQSKRKRGRPRKYPLDGTVTPRVKAPPPPRPEPAFSSPAAVAEAAFSTPAPVAEAVFSSPAPVAEVAFSSPAPVAAASSVPGKKSRGRPRGSGQKQHVAPIGAAGWSAGIGLSPHVITIKAGEDVSSKIMSFSQSGAQTICVLAANGAISNVTLRQAATSGGSVTYEGRFEILSLSGSYTVLESGGQRSRTGGLSVLLAGPDGRVLGGGVAGLLIAAAPVQVIVGGFLPAQEFKAPIQADPVASAPPKLNHGASAAGSPTSRGTLSESSGGGSGSPLNQSTGAYNNSNNPQGMTTFSWK